MRSSTERRPAGWVAVGLAVTLLGACSSGDEAAAPTSPATTTQDPTSTRPTTSTTSTIEPETTEPEPTEPETTRPSTSTSTTTTTTTTTTSVAPDTTAPRCPQLPIGVTELTLTGGGAEHPVRMFVPSSFTGQRTPTVLNWHGLGSNGPEQAALSGYEAVAEAEGFIVVHPTGVPTPGTDRNSWELDDGRDPGRDDLAFANALIDLVIAEWCADPIRIYSTGMSNGGFFTARLVCEAADLIAAAASIAGTSHPEGCSPARPVPYLAFHGTADAVVPFDGSGESTLVTGDDPGARAFFEQVMPDEFAEFAADAGCAPEPTTTPVGADVTRYDYTGCTDDTPLTFFEVARGGHTWPGSPIGDALEGLLGYATKDVSATTDAWAFFEQHTLPD